MGSENFTPAHVKVLCKDAQRLFATSLRHFCEDVAILLREEYVSSHFSLQAMHNKQVCGAVLTSCRGLLDMERGVQQSYQTGIQKCTFKAFYQLLLKTDVFDTGYPICTYDWHPKACPLLCESP